MQLLLNAIDFMADGGPAGQPGKPGKRALCIEEGGQQGEAAGKQQETPQANKNVANSRSRSRSRYIYFSNAS